MREWLWRLRTFLFSGREIAQRTEEMQSHFEMTVERGLADGLSREEAERNARLSAGAVPAAMESARDEMGFKWLNAVGSELRHAVRSLIKARGFTGVAVSVLAATVAVNTGIFFLLEGVVLRPLPYKEPGRLVRLYDSTDSQPKFPMSLGRFTEYRDQAKSLAGIALYTGADRELSGEGAPERLIGVRITPEFFAVLGTRTQIGREFTASDTDRNNHNVIISHGLWMRKFQGDPAVLGRTIQLDREAWTIIGVAPRGFQHVGGEFRSPLQGETVDVWTSINLDGVAAGRGYGSHYCNAIARMADGYTRQQVFDELSRISEANIARLPRFGKWRVRMEPLAEEIAGQSGRVLWMLLAAGGLVMLIACANISSLCIARGMARHKEFAVRQALGAGRWQLLRIGLMENVLIGVVGATIGLALAAAGLPLLRAVLPAAFPRLHEIEFTTSSAVFASALAIGTALLAGLLPGLRLLAGDPASGLHNQSRQFSPSRDARRMRAILVMSEVALAGVLCAGAILLVRSYRQLEARDNGFDADGVLTFHLAIPGVAYSGQEKSAQIFRAIRERLGRVPGVVAVGATTNLPWSGYDENSGFGIVGGQQDGPEGPGGRYQAATPGYFEAMRMRLRQGRFFDERDESRKPYTLIVNTALVRRYFPNENPIGRKLALWGEQREIVGVVEGIPDAPADLRAEAGFWFPMGQMAFLDSSFAIRLKGDPLGYTGALQSALREVDPQLAISNVRTMETRVASAMAERRFALFLFEAFTGLALALAAVGIYGLLAYLVQQRRKEMGIRMAMGATKGNVFGLVIRDGLYLAVGGAVAVLALTPLTGRLMESFLFGVRATDAAIVLAPTLLLTIAAGASLLPARLAANCSPATALRDD